MTREADDGRDARRGAAWKWIPELEAALELRKNRPGEYDKLPPDLKMTLGYYERDKRAARRAGRDVRAPKGERR